VYRVLAERMELGPEGAEGALSTALKKTPSHENESLDFIADIE
jgi:hypothetical protein